MKALRRLSSDERGNILVLFVVLVPVLLGMVGLALEIGQALMLNSQLQNLADAAALAGANELNGEPDAIDRATNAAKNYSLQNTPWWSNIASPGYQVEDPPVFYSQLKGLPSANPAAADVVTTDPAKAFFIKVVTVPRSVNPILLRFVGAIGNLTTRATATAMSSYVACKSQPMMLCNPFEKADGTGPTFKTAVDEGLVKPGFMFHMKVLNDPGSSGSNKSYAPGDFGLLDPPGCNSSGANTVEDLLSQQSPGFCFDEAVSPRTGQAVQKVNQGINVRFDMPITGTTTSKACNMTTALDQTPAPNVTKGLKTTSNGCAQSANQLNPDYTGNTGDTGALPRDTDWTSYGNMQLGNGQIDMTAANHYWQYHHGANWPSDLQAIGQPNRYLAYEREIKNMSTKDYFLPNTEPAGPTCNTTTNSESIPERRLIHFAVIDCLANNIQGNSVTGIRVNSYAEFFITEPSANGDVWGEFQQLITEDTPGGGLHHIVQLVRDN